ncbi:MAG: M20 family metallopeptidase [Sphaerobacter sp.]|nr:M20 family metallopeptidase [Sphaerobacter sp.]
MTGSTPRLDPQRAERVLAHIDPDEVVAFLQALVRIPSVNPPGDVRAAIDHCRATLSAAGFGIEVVAAEEDKPNLLARLDAGAGPVLLWNAHVDVVPTGEESAWTYPPFGAEIHDGRIYGRGAGDDKASVTAQVMAALALARSGVPLRGTLIVNVVADEEVGGAKGAQLIANSDTVRPDFVIVGEQTRNRVCVGEKGAQGTRVTVYGRAAHGALPWEGANAIEGMARVIVALQEQLWPELARRTHPYFHPSSACISMIEGGVKTNVVPDRCTIHIDRRIVPGETPAGVVDEIRRVAEAAIAPLPGLRVEVEPAGWGGREAIVAPEDSPLVQAMLAANRHLGFDTTLTGFSMATDGRHFVARGYPTIIYGPGDPALAHKPDEWVGIDEVLDATRAYALAGLIILGAA